MNRKYREKPASSSTVMTRIFWIMLTMLSSKRQLIITFRFSVDDSVRVSLNTKLTNLTNNGIIIVNALLRKLNFKFIKFYLYQF